MNLSSKISKLFLRVHDKEEKKKRIEKKGKEKQSPMGKFRNENNPPRGTVSPALYPSLPDSLWLDASPCPSTPTLLSGYFARFNLARLSVSAKLRWRKEPPATRSSCIPVVPENHVRPFPTCDEGLQVSVRLREQDRLPFVSPPRINEEHTRFSSRLNKIIELATLWRKIAFFHSTHVSFYKTIQIKSCQISTWNFVEIVLDGTSRSSSINRTVGNRESGVRKEGRSDRKNLRRGIEKRGKREERRIDRQRVRGGWRISSPETRRQLILAGSGRIFRVWKRAARRQPSKKTPTTNKRERSKKRAPAANKAGRRTRREARRRRRERVKREEEEVFLLAGTCAHRPLLVTRKKGLDPQEGTKKEKRRGSVQSGKWRQCAADRQRVRVSSTPARDLDPPRGLRFHPRLRSVSLHLSFPKTRSLAPR